MDEADAPHGLNMSLDDIIKENSKNKKLHNKNRNNGQQYKKGSTQQQGSRGRGRGGRGPSRGTGRGNQSYARGQQQAVQDFTQNYAQAYANPDRIVMVQDPDTSYRQVSHIMMLYTLSATILQQQGPCCAVSRLLSG